MSGQSTEYQSLLIHAPQSHYGGVRTPASDSFQGAYPSWPRIPDRQMNIEEALGEIGNVNDEVRIGQIISGWPKWVLLKVLELVFKWKLIVVLSPGLIAWFGTSSGCPGCGLTQGGHWSIAYCTPPSLVTLCNARTVTGSHVHCIVVLFIVLAHCSALCCVIPRSTVARYNPSRRPSVKGEIHCSAAELCTSRNTLPGVSLGSFTRCVAGAVQLRCYVTWRGWREEGGAHQHLTRGNTRIQECHVE